MLVTITAVAAIVPSLLLMWYFHSRDVNREPGRVLWATFLLGVLMVVPVVFVALLLERLAQRVVHGPWLLGLSGAFLGAAIPEEGGKLLVVRGYSVRHREFDEPMDGIVYGVVASLGFATLENILYTLKRGLGLALTRAFTAVPAHAFCGAIMGYHLSRGRFEPTARGNLLRAIVWPSLLHGAYDFPLMVIKEMGRSVGEMQMTDEQSRWLLLLVLVTFAVLVVEWLWASKLTRRLRSAQLAAQPSRTP